MAKKKTSKKTSAKKPGKMVYYFGKTKHRWQGQA